jgi:hypothetical protein
MLICGHCIAIGPYVYCLRYRLPSVIVVEAHAQCLDRAQCSQIVDLRFQALRASTSWSIKCSSLLDEQETIMVLYGPGGLRGLVGTVPVQQGLVRSIAHRHCSWRNSVRRCWSFHLDVSAARRLSDTLTFSRFLQSVGGGLFLASTDNFEVMADKGSAAPSVPVRRLLYP